jgi:hypothetical protein
MPPVTRLVRLIAIASALTATLGCDKLLTPALYGSLKVQVTRYDGTPIAAVPLTVNFGGRRMAAGITDSAGFYTFELLPEAEYGVYAKVIPGYSLPESVRPGPRTDFVDSIAVTRGATGTARLSLLKIGPGSVIAKVTEPNGTPVADVPVTLYSGSNGPFREDTTDASGQVLFTNVPFGDWGVQVVRPVRFRDKFDWPFDQKDGLIVEEGGAPRAEFTMARCGGAVSMRVHDNANFPVPGARVVLYSQGTDLDSVFVDSAGSHTFEPLGCNDFGVRVTDVPIGWRIVPGPGTSYIDGIIVYRGDATPRVTLYVAREACRGIIRAVVTDNTGATVGNAEVVVYTGTVHYQRSFTHANGVASFVDLPCDRDWGVFVIPPASHALSDRGYVDGIRLVDKTVTEVKFLLTRR